MDKPVALASPRAPLPAPARDAVERVRARSRATGALVMTGFGALWAGLAAAAMPWPALVGALVALLTVVLLLAAVRSLRAHSPVREALPADAVARMRRGKRIFAWALAAEGVGIPLAVNVVIDLGHPQWQLPAIMAVVGLHFLPLAHGFGYRPHWITGVAMTAWALAWPWLLPAGAMSPVGPLAGGAMLFASAAWALRSAR